MALIVLRSVAIAPQAKGYRVAQQAVSASITSVAEATKLVEVRRLITIGFAFDLIEVDADTYAAASEGKLNGFSKHNTAEALKDYQLDA